MLALTSAIRLVIFGQPIDWLTVMLVVIAAVAAIAHRNAVVGLEARGRGEAESFARILRGLSRSVSADSIVSAILDDLIDATSADHVVLVRRRPEARSLEATLVTRRSGVPTTATVLPVSLLEPELDGSPVAGVPVGPGLPETHDGATSGQPTAVSLEGAPGSTMSTVTTRVARRASDVGLARTLVRRIAAESLALLEDIGLPTPDLLSSRGTARPVEVLARGPEAAIVERVAVRAGSAFGLSHTLAAPLRSEQGVIGAIVISRRDRHPWSESAKRLLRGATSETAAALERAESYREATAGAATDPLTGLPNRRYFDEFATLIAGGRRAGDGAAVLMIDIDRFKGLNDTYGHPVGDQVLRSVAEAITAAVRDQDVPARIGGEEFAVLLRNPGPADAVEVGERVRQAVRNLDLGRLGVPGVSVSVGVANANGPDEAIRDLVDRADRALLRAKRAGRDRVVAG